MENKQIYKIVNFETKDMRVVKEDGEEFLEFEGLAAAFGNIDLQHEILEKGCFKTAKAKKVKLLLMHDSRSIPLGIFTTLKETDEGLFVVGKMPLEDDLVKGRVKPQMKLGSLNSMSVGFFVKDCRFETIKGCRIMIIEKAELFEISLVNFPANPEAKIVAVKDYLHKLEDNTEDVEEKTATPLNVLPKKIVKGKKWDKKKGINDIKAATGSEEEPSSSYRKGFLWYDAEEADLYGSYKLPIAEKFDGKLSINFRAVVAASAALQGARGGVDIPTNDKNKIKRTINRIYEKAGEDPPFASKDYRIGMVEIAYCDKDELEYLMKNYAFKTNTAKIAVSFLHEGTPEDNRDGDADGEPSVENDRDGDQAAMKSIISTANNIVNNEF